MRPATPSSDDDGWDDPGVDRWELGGDSHAKAVPGGLARATDFAAPPDGQLVVCSHR